jgi:hypothetical protein
MKTYGKLIALALAAGLVAFAAPSAMAVSAGSNIIDTENNCLDMPAFGEAMCISDETINPVGVGHELMAMNDLGEVLGFDAGDVLGEDAWTDGWIMVPTKKLLPSPLNVAGVLLQTCATETIAAADIDIMMPLPEEMIDTTATADICQLDWDVGLSTPT